MTKDKIKVLSSANQTVFALRNKREQDHNKSKKLISAQSSVLSPRSSNGCTTNFAKICTELLRDGHIIKFRAPGDSMYPTICDGDIITVAPVKTACVTTGDIILYRHISGVTAHRVIRIATKELHHYQYTTLKPQSSVVGPQTYFILRGDAAVVLDDPVFGEQVLGRVTFVERQGRCVDPYSLKATICFKARRMAARLKRFLRSET